jgi:membrane protease YdiL (CAAX protease family)
MLPRAIEFVALFVACPAAVAEFVPKQGLIPSILIFFFVCLALLLLDESFDRKSLWNWRAARRELPRIFLIAAFGIAFVTGLVLVLRPEVFLSLPRQHPVLWVIIMLAYPLASVYPQEVIFRAFFFHRYRTLFGQHSLIMILISAAAFGYAHIVLKNWLAVSATLAGGLLFGWTYARSRSVAATAIEHAIYGCFMFTVGLGQFFYNGAWG